MSSLTIRSLAVSFVLFQLIPYLSGFPTPFALLKGMKNNPESEKLASDGKVRVYTNSMFEYWTPQKESKGTKIIKNNKIK